jgi:hypothetical protein
MDRAGEKPEPDGPADNLMDVPAPRFGVNLLRSSADDATGFSGGKTTRFLLFPGSTNAPAACTV